MIETAAYHQVVKMTASGNPLIAETAHVLLKPSSYIKADIAAILAPCR